MGNTVKKGTTAARPFKLPKTDFNESIKQSQSVSEQKPVKDCSIENILVQEKPKLAPRHDHFYDKNNKKIKGNF